MFYNYIKYCFLLLIFLYLVHHSISFLNINFFICIYKLYSNMSAPSTQAVDTKSTQSKTLGQKFYYAGLSALLFIALSLPFVYEKTNSIGLNTYAEKCPTAIGRFAHTTVFFALNYFMMKIMSSYGSSPKKSDGMLLKFAFYGALIFFLLSSPESYELTQNLYRGDTFVNAPGSGCPTYTGVIVHGIVFMLAVVLVMFFPEN
jgi:hypothetical protein